MRMKKKKVFQSEKLNKIRLLERLVNLIPVAYFLYIALTMRQTIVEALTMEASLAVIVVILFAISLLTFIKTIVPYFVLKIFLRKRKKQIMRNSSFISVADFDYYRDKLEGMSPGIISLLADLEIEQKKDVAACILKYKEMGLLREEDGIYQVGDYQNANLRKSDAYLLEGLKNHTFQLKHDIFWRQLVECEAIEEGYIRNRISSNTGNNKIRNMVGCCKGCVIPIILFVLTMTMAVHVSTVMEPLDTILSAMPDDLSLEKQLEYIQEYPQCYPVIAELILVLILSVVTFYSPVLAVVSAIGSVFHISRFQRTEYGNEMAECIYGMKNFIHDFSCLSEAEQEQVVLWDDYLVYAVVLEENQQIVDEIMKRRDKRW